MAYPFAPAVSFAELKARLQREFACRYLRLDGRLIDPDGKERPVYYFERDLGDGNTARATAPDLADDDRVLFSVIRSLCARLKIDPDAFGLNLG